MSFWRGETLKARRSSIIKGTNYSDDDIDCNAYTLHLGPEIYVSPSRKKLAGEAKTKLAPGDGKAIPPGQFAFLLTEESVDIPRNAMAFISMRSTYKFQGLVNVSGFHVDPGYRGRLVFAVFNASANHVHLHRGDACFLIWFADLDDESNSPYVKTEEGFVDISSKIVNPVGSGKIESLAGLSARIDTLENSLKVVYAITLLVAGVILTTTARQCVEANRPTTPPVTVVVPGPSQAPSGTAAVTPAPTLQGAPANTPQVPQVAPTPAPPSPSRGITPPQPR